MRYMVKYVSKAEKRSKPLLNVFRSVVRHSDPVPDEPASKLRSKHLKTVANGTYPLKRLRV